MKKILTVIIFVLTALLICGCKKYDHPIAGKTYQLILSTNMYNCVSFFKNGNCEWRMREPHRTTIENHFKWEVHGNDITIRYDHSTTWKPSARGMIWRSGHYNPSDDTVIFDGSIYFAY